MTDLEYIDNYFSNSLNKAERLAFEKRLNSDESFAQETAIYTSTKAIEREKLLEQKHAEWSRRPEKKGISLSLVVSGIAALLIITAGLWFFNNKESDYKTLAQSYITNELSSIPIKMDANADSLELGKGLYNEKKFDEAYNVFKDLSGPKALEYAGLSALKSKNYTDAISAFEQLSLDTNLLENKGKFYLVLTYFQMNEIQKAETLLKEIKKNGLYGANLLDAEK